MRQTERERGTRKRQAGGEEEEEEDLGHISSQESLRLKGGKRRVRGTRYCVFFTPLLFAYCQVRMP